jgi:hypothetical protein
MRNPQPTGLHPPPGVTRSNPAYAAIPALIRAILTFCDECVDLAQTIIDAHRGKPNELRMPIWESWIDEQMLEAHPPHGGRG